MTELKWIKFQVDPEHVAKATYVSKATGLSMGEVYRIIFDLAVGIYTADDLSNMIKAQIDARDEDAETVVETEPEPEEE